MMKVNGRTLTGPRIVERYLPVNGGEVCFKFRPLTSDENFEKVYAKPRAPKIRKPDGVHSNTDDPGYRDALSSWAQKKLAWEFLISVSITEGLEWATVKMEDPETWLNWESEAKTHFGDGALNKIFDGFLEAQYITEEVMEKARARFLIGQQVQLEQLSLQKDEAESTQSGEPAKD